MKNVNKLAILAFASALLLTSCGKKDAASVKELDGTWTVASVIESSTSKSTDTQGTDKDIYESEESKTITNGTITGEETGKYTSTSGSYTTITTQPTTKLSGKVETTVTFSKKDGSYVSEESGEEISERTTTSTSGTGTYAYTYTTVVKSTDKFTQTEEGTYYLNGSVGDTKKGTKLIVDLASNVRKGSITTVTTTTMTYSGTTTTSSSTSTDDYTTTYTRDGNSQTMIYDLTEATKTSLKFSNVGSYTMSDETSHSYTSGSTTTITKSQEDYEVTSSSDYELTK